MVFPTFGGIHITTTATPITANIITPITIKTTSTATAINIATTAIAPKNTTTNW